MRKIFRNVELYRANEPDLCKKVYTPEELERACANTVFPIAILDMPVNSEFDFVLDDAIGACSDFRLVNNALLCDVLLFVDDETIPDLKKEHNKEELFLTPIFTLNEKGEADGIDGVFFGNFLKMETPPVNYMIED